MRHITLGPTHLEVPVIAVGCMRMDTLKPADAKRFVEEALELGANFFDHADVYGDAIPSEQVFAEAITMSPSIREQIIGVRILPARSLAPKAPLFPGQQPLRPDHLWQAPHQRHQSFDAALHSWLPDAPH